MIPTRIFFQIHDSRRLLITRLQNSASFCLFKYPRAVKQKVWNEAENRDPDWGETLFSLASHALRAYKARAFHARKTLTPRFTDFLTDFEKKKTDCFAVYLITYSLNDFHSGYVVSFCIVYLVFKLLFPSRIM